MIIMITMIRITPIVVGNLAFFRQHPRIEGKHEENPIFGGFQSHRASPKSFIFMEFSNINHSFLGFSDGFPMVWGIPFKRLKVPPMAIEPPMISSASLARTRWETTRSAHRLKESTEGSDNSCGASPLYRCEYIYIYITYIDIYI